jgi:hypothetical protein
MISAMHGTLPSRYSVPAIQARVRGGGEVPMREQHDAYPGPADEHAGVEAGGTGRAAEV